MTPLEMIKTGLENEDFTLIQKAYKIMSGETVKVGSGNSQQFVTEHVEAEHIANTNMKSNGNPRFTKKIPIQLSKVNLFTDTGERGDKTTTIKTVKKKKGPSLFVDVVCKECGDSRKINKELLPVSFEDGVRDKKRPYVCDDCIARRR